MTNLEEMIYNWLQSARVHNRKAKNKTHTYTCNVVHYSEKYSTVMRCIKEIKNNKIKTIKITVIDDNEIHDMILVRFNFLNQDVRHRSISFHLPSYYKNMIKENLC